MAMLSADRPDFPRRVPRLLAAAAFAVMLAPALPALAAGGGPVGFADMADRLLPAVVNVSTTQTIKPDETPGGPRRLTPPKGGERDAQPEKPGSPFDQFFKDFFDRQQRDQSQAPRKATSLGSGFIIDAGGYIVTNNHVIDGADEIMVTLHDNSETQLKAKLVGRDTKTDLALLKVESKSPLPFVPWGDSDKSRVGDWVVAIGNPFGLGGTVTAGIVSAKTRNIDAGPYDDFIQTDASINKGNSGGPMFNMAGEVIGINTAILSPSGGSVGIGFAIPAVLAKPVIEQLRQYGKVRRGWLGVRIQTVTEELAENLGLDKPKGALVSKVDDNGPAAKGKVEAGDVILKFDGREIGDLHRLPRVVAETAIDKTVDVIVWRKRKELTLHVKIAELAEEEKQASADQPTPNAPAPSGVTVNAFGLTLVQVTPDLREKFGLADDASGVVVSDVATGSAAGEKGVKPGDLVVEVNQGDIKSPEDVTKRLAEAKKQNKRSVLILIDQKGDLRFVTVPVDKG